jgi:flavodoxin
VILQNYDLICLGGPTHIARISNPMKDFLIKLKPVDLQEKKGFCFGTRMNSRMNVFNINGSAKKIEKKLKKKGVHMVKDAVNVLVEGREGPLTEDSEDRFTEIGYELGGIMHQ